MEGKATLIVRNTSELVTVASNGCPKKGTEMSELGIIPNGAIAISGETIIWTGHESELHTVPKEPFCKTIDAAGCSVLPGFVEPHTHLIFSGTREDEFSEKIAGVPYLDIAAKGGGIKRTVKNTREASFEDLLQLGEQRLREAIRFGITTLEIKSGYGLNIETEKKILRVARKLGEEFPMDLPRTFLGAHEIPKDSSKEQYIDSICQQMIPEIAQEKLAEFCDIFVEKGVYNIDDADKVLSCGLKYGLTPKIHAEQMTNSGGALKAASLKAISADHLDYIDEISIDALAKAGTIGVILPGAVFFLGLKKYAPARSMINRNMAVAISTDFNPGSCMSLNIQLMMTIACTQNRMTTEEVISASTINAAFAVNRGQICGSLEIGKRADIVILDTPSYKMLPYHFGHNHVKNVICNGNLLVNNFLLTS